jgi:energy-coupling factor transporter ATP-binding protein EcfA2
MYYQPYQLDNKRYLYVDTDGKTHSRHNLPKPPSTIATRKAIENSMALYFDGKRWKQVSLELYFKHTESVPTTEVKQPTEKDSEHSELMNFIHMKSYSMKPKHLFMDELRWKYAVRSVIRSQNMLILGPTGSGKTMMVKWLAEALERPLHIFNLGSTQDPRSTLIGNTHFDSERGTFFNQSPFVKAIQQPNSIILLDEVSRANPEAFNILMSVLDPHQRYLRLDESKDTELIKVHPTVTFIGTANVGNEYTSTRVIDRALSDRFVTIQMDYLDRDGEVQLLSGLFDRLSSSDIYLVADIVDLIRTDIKKENSNLEHNLSTRHSIEMASLLNDGFTISEVLDIVVYPNYSTEGGLDSERTYVKQLIQSKVDNTNVETPVWGEQQ